MSRQHLVRVGSLGHVGRFTSVDAVRYPRGSRVICRTSRGLEIGEVLSPADEDQQDADGSLLRGMTTEDELLQARLEKHRDRAYEACCAILNERRLPVVLMDVEHLFDGQSLYFYFLGDVTPELEHVTNELAEAYEAKVQFRKFTETVINGCGPGCGTEEGGGCSDGTCSSCVLAGACAAQSRN